MSSELKAGAAIDYVSIVVRLATSFILTPFVIKIHQAMSLVNAIHESERERGLAFLKAHLS